MSNNRRDVVIRPLSGPGEADAAAALLARIWGADGIGAELIRALEHSGNCVLGAFAGDRLLGASVAVLALAPDGRLELHSHVLGVDAEARGRQLGAALKLRQRLWARERGVARISWTTDPLVRANAHFNLVTLGARVAGYEESFYGRRSDAINAGEETDRIVISWEVGPWARPPSGAVVAPAHARPLLAVGDGGDPLPLAPAEGEGPRLIAVPDDVVALRAADPPLARRWRLAVRAALGGELAAGRRVTGMTADHRYLTEEAR